MATYIIGDVHGCFQPLKQLLQQIEYDPQRDTLWFVGDIFNRGPEPLACLRFVHDLVEQGRGRMVLGNHDLHLLAIVAGFTRFRSRRDTLDEILQAPDRDTLIHWLRHQPLLLENEQNGQPWAMVHAGLPPAWDMPTARKHARLASEALQDAGWQTFMRTEMYGDEPHCAADIRSETEALRYTFNALCRMRYCTADSCLEFFCKLSPDQADLPPEYGPWFAHPNRRNLDTTLFFGHWSTLGAYDGHNVHALDTGCLWGGQLTAWCVEEKRRHALTCPRARTPG